jgi:hypothetical protein
VANPSKYSFNPGTLSANHPSIDEAVLPASKSITYEFSGVNNLIVGNPETLTPSISFSVESTLAITKFSIIF